MLAAFSYYRHFKMEYQQTPFCYKSRKLFLCKTNAPDKSRKLFLCKTNAPAKEIRFNHIYFIKSTTEHELHFRDFCKTNT